MSRTKSFDPDCRQCDRLANFLDELGETYPDYHNRPVKPFGVRQPSLLIVGLAPGMHGANATGRPFTGDFAGILLYQTMYDFGFASKPQSISRSDGLKLINCRITNAVKCLPPQNKPLGDEIKRCNPFLSAEIQALQPGCVILALGTVAHNAVLRALGKKLSAYKFGHGHEHDLDDWTLIDSYHCSRYNTQTGRLTDKMFHDIFRRVVDIMT